jgi:hypothetical protein
LGSWDVDRDLNNSVIEGSVACMGKFLR